MLSIAGSDSCGGAGIQADIKTCSALGVYAMTAITAVTAQNTMGVSGVFPVPADLLRAQLDAVLADICPDAVKIGMIPNAECAEVIADTLEKYDLKNVILDPVMVATSGDRLSDDSVYQVMCRRLFPQVSLITPNMPEASFMLQAEVTEHTIEMCAEALLRMNGISAVLLKGGHAGSAIITDVLAVSSEDGNHVYKFEHPAVETNNTHGTGCSLSSAIASFMAANYPIHRAVSEAVSAISAGIGAGRDYAIGHGHGAINHFALEKFRIK